jgi:hypothetical protein
MKTKKYIIPLVAVIALLVIVLVACGAKSSTSAQTGSSGTPVPNGTPGARNLTQPLPLAEQLVVGTFKLDGTSNAITSAQATGLIPLWQAYTQLTSSNTAAQAEIDAVIAQIQSTMTPQQIQAITDMKLTRQDLTATLTSLGLSNGFGGNGTGTPRASGAAGGGFFPGDGADAGGGRGGAGGFPGGGGAPGAGGTGGTRPTPNATQQALRAQFANRIPTPLMNALVSLLQKKAGA